MSTDHDTHHSGSHPPGSACVTAAFADGRVMLYAPDDIDAWLIADERLWVDVEDAA